jgi:pre-mRNA-splicing factor ISY1
MLNKWLRYKSSLAAGGGAGQGGGGRPERRPALSSEVSNLIDCEKWRKQVVRETAEKVQQIQVLASGAVFVIRVSCLRQNGGLGEHRIRDLNDEINKLLREKRHWERRIR